MLVFDSVGQLLGETHSPQLMSAALRQLVGALAESSCALVFLTQGQAQLWDHVYNCPLKGVEDR